MSTKHSEDLQHIRSMMERSSRFISLSGLSGVFAGIFALLAAFLANRVLQDAYQTENWREIGVDTATGKLLIIFFSTLLLGLASGIVFTVRKSKKQNLPVFNKTTYRILVNLGVPLFFGALVCLAFYLNHSSQYIAASTLMFYGMGLFAASNFTYGDIRYLAYSEMILGTYGFFDTYHGLLLWTLGFGVLHIIYGVIVYKKYQ